MFLIQAHGRQVLVALLVVVASYVVQVHLEPSILSVVDPETVFGKHNESLVRLNIHAVYGRGHQRVLLLDGSLIELREPTLVENLLTDLDLLGSQ